MYSAIKENAIHALDFGKNLPVIFALHLFIKNMIKIYLTQSSYFLVVFRLDSFIPVLYLVWKLVSNLVQHIQMIYYFTIRYTNFRFHLFIIIRGK